jgi:Uma2 family endonuclease
MATMEPKTRRYTYEDLAGFPQDNLRRELIDGELVVTAAPSTRHQGVVMRLAGELYQYAKEHGGEVFPAPTDVYFSETSIVEPDVLFVSAENLSRVEPKFIRSAPDVVVEVSSPSTRRLELHRKLELYERYGVPEYWYADLESDRVEVYRLDDGRYGSPALLTRKDVLESSRIPGFSIGVDELLGPAED